MADHLVMLDNVSLAFGLDVLLDGIKLQVSVGERLCLIGRNGTGKSSLLKIIEGTQLPDRGSVWRKPTLRVARLSQELPLQESSTVYEFVAEGLAETGKLLSAYHALTHKLSTSCTSDDLIQLERLQQAIDGKDGWQFEQRMTTILMRLELDPDIKVASLSGGWQRRAALARALVTSPELLLLDEPTNHLDIEAIQWLEDQLMNEGIGLIFITHDRALLQRLATRIIELDRGQLTSWPGDYANFLRRKEELLQAEENQAALFDKKLALEEKWIRQGIKARRTRNEGRVRALEALRKERAARREVQGKTTFLLNEAKKSGKLVIDLDHVSHYFGDKCILRDFSLRVIRGDRIALIGPNGVGKSTFLNILLKNLEPSKGVVTHGTQLEIAYFDQLRAALDLEKTVLDNVAEGNDFIEIDGKKRHVISYLGDFLFTPERARTPVKALSGGESNRLLLARLFSRPSNLLVLDEPTNDLDIETLELLESLLMEYQGTILLVSHDRVFLDNVATSTLVLSGNGQITEYIGGYRESHQVIESSKPVLPETRKAEKPKAVSLLDKKPHSKELAAIQKIIEKQEARQAEIHDIMSSPDFYQKPSDEIARVIKELDGLTADIAEAYARWELLDH